MIRCERCKGIGMHRAWCPDAPAAPDGPERAIRLIQLPGTLRAVLDGEQR